MSHVPIVDLDTCKDTYTLSEDDADIKRLSKEIYDAFSTIGFVYLKNHGISQELVTDAFQKSLQFFNQPKSTKEKYTRPQGLSNHGWCEIGREILNTERPGDLKEVFDVNTCIVDKVWPGNDVVDGFQRSLEELYFSCRLLASKLLKLIGIGLGLEDPEYFCKRHNMDRQTYTALRCLYYPSFTSETDLKSKQLRCGEHTDYGSLTILFQDDTGGLEVFTREEKYVSAPPIPGTIIVNLGDLMQRWTADRLVSTKHRVINPPIGNGISAKSRQSIVCFIHPDEDCIVECVGGSNKYPPIKDKDYIERRFKDTHI